MASFKYVAKDQEGRSMNGVVEAPDQASAINAIRKKDLVIISIFSAPAGFSLGRMKGLFRKKIKLDDMVIFSRQLATMVDAGIPLVGALDILEEQSDNKTFAEVIGKVRADVEAGASLSDGLAKHKKIFTPLFVNMVKAGESSGMLDEILDRLAEYMEKTNALNKKVKSALIYPAVVTVMAFGITLLLLLKVIPIFKTMFADFGAQLPTPTMVLLSISDFLRKYILLVTIIFIAVVVALARYFKTERGSLRMDRTMLNMPIFGILFKKVAISKFTRTLSTLIKSGVPILAAFEIVGKTSGNKVVEIAIENVRKNVREGENIAEPLAKSGVFPPMVTRMVSVGEQTGQLEKMLSKIADFYDQQVDAAVSGLTSLIEPLIIAFLGIVIGGIVICMFLPIFKMTEVVGM